MDVVANDGNGEPLDPASVQLVGTGSPGDSLSVPGERTWIVDSSTGAVTFTPVAGFTGVPNPVTYTVADIAGKVSAPASNTLSGDAIRSMAAG